MYDELFKFWLLMKTEKDSDKRDEIIDRTTCNLEGFINQTISAERARVCEVIDGMKKPLPTKEEQNRGEDIDYKNRRNLVIFSNIDGYNQALKEIKQALC